MDDNEAQDTLLDYVLGGAVLGGLTLVVSVPVKLIWNIQPFWRLTWRQSWVITTLMWASCIGGIQLQAKGKTNPVRW